MKFVREKRPELDETWFDKPSETTIILGDGNPGFKIDMSKQAEELKKKLKENAK